MEALEALFRWMHVFAGIIWIGHLYFFNWVNGPFQTKIDGPTKKLVNPGIDAARSLLVPLGSGIYMDHRRASVDACLLSRPTGARIRRRMVRRNHRHDRRDVPRGLYL